MRCDTASAGGLVKRHRLQCDPRSTLRAAIVTIREKEKNMGEKGKPEKSQAQILRDDFEGMKGRQPESDRELKEWLATDEGKAATIFEPTQLSNFGDERSGGIPPIQILRDAFEGMKGRQPESDQELKQWLATSEGKKAESSLNSQFTESGHS
jgi:hypothetical protein